MAYQAPLRTQEERELLDPRMLSLKKSMESYLDEQNHRKEVVNKDGTKRLEDKMADKVGHHEVYLIKTSI
jgi:hypothetical protein